MFEIRPFRILSLCDFLFNHVERDRLFDDTKIITIKLFTRKIQEVVGNELASRKRKS